MKKLMSKLNKFRLYWLTKKRFFASAVVLAVTVTLGAQAFLPITAQAADPQFNIFTPYSDTQQTNRDYYLLRGKNDTQGTSFTSSSVSANPGDILTFYIFYHNGIDGSIANNTRIRATLPSGSGTSQYVSASLTADNANYLSQGLSVNLSSAGALTYVSGSAKWFPNQVDWRVASPTAFPSGQAGDQLFTSGINIGSIQGCWPYSGAVVFQAQVSPIIIPPPMPSLSIQKTVANLTSGANYYDSVNAQYNDRLGFQIRVTNNSIISLSNVSVRDQLPSNMNYAYGTTRLDGSYVGDGIASGGINIGSLNVGQTRTIIFEATMNLPYQYYSATTLTNYAYASANSVGEVSDSALVYVSGQTQQGYLNLYKYVRNTTTGQGYLASSANASPGDNVLFSIQLSVPTGQVNNVYVRDVLPSGLTYVSGTARLDSATISDSVIYGGLNIGTLFSSQSKTLTLNATVNSGISNQTLTNTVYAYGDGVSQQSATAQVVVGGSVIQPSGLNKRVANLTAPNGTDTNNTANAGHTLQYTLSYTNTTGNTLYNVRLIDVLPSYTAFISADNGGNYTTSGNQIIWNLGSLSPSASVNVSYQARVQTVPTNGYVIANTALLTADNTNQLISNETRTTVYGVVLGETVKAVTGSDDLPRNLAISLTLSILGIMALYFAKEYPIFWRQRKFHLAVLKIKMKELLS